MSSPAVDRMNPLTLAARRVAEVNLRHGLPAGEGIAGLEMGISGALPPPGDISTERGTLDSEYAGEIARMTAAGLVSNALPPIEEAHKEEIEEVALPAVAPVPSQVAKRPTPSGTNFNKIMGIDLSTGEGGTVIVDSGETFMIYPEEAQNLRAMAWRMIVRGVEAKLGALATSLGLVPMAPPSTEGVSGAATGKAVPQVPKAPRKRKVPQAPKAE